jgi:glyoxalase/bleomycin resistance protein/dioxygenase superfamily protein
MIKRFDRLDIAATDASGAGAVYEKNFGFKVRRTGNDEAVIALGDSEIRLRSGAAVADVIASSGEGLAAIWLEAEDLDALAAAFTKAGVGFSPIRREADRRVLAVDPKSSNMAPVYIFDRR